MITLTSTVIDRRTRQILKNIPRVAATKSTEYNIISKSIFLRIIIRKFMKIRELFHVKTDAKMSKSTCLKWTYGFFTILYLTV